MLYNQYCLCNNDDDDDGEPIKSIFLFQQLSTALQRGNAVAFLNTFDSD